MLLLRFDGSLLLRFAERQLSASLFQEPPRTTRLEPVSRQPPTILNPATRRRKRYESAWATWAYRLAAVAVSVAWSTNPLAWWRSNASALLQKRCRVRRFNRISPG